MTAQRSDIDLLPTPPADPPPSWPLSRRGRIGVRLRKVFAVLITIAVPVVLGVVLVDYAGFPRLAAAAVVAVAVVLYFRAFSHTFGERAGAGDEDDEDVVA